MSELKSVTAEELIRALKRRKATLPAEIGSFVVLEACEALLQSGPRILTPAEVHILEEGTVRISQAASCSELEAARGLHRLLASMLVAAGPAPLPALMRLLEEGPSNGRWTLASVRNDLEASLVPLNREASRRVLSRFVREVGWTERAPAKKKPTFQDLDSELNSFLDEASPGKRRPLQFSHSDVTVDDSIDSVDEAQDQVEFFESGRPAPREPTGRTVLEPVPHGASQVPERISGAPGSLRPSAAEVAREQERRERAPSMRPMPRRPRVPSEIPRPARSNAWIWGVLLLALSAGIVIATFQLRPEAFSRLQKPDPLEALPPQPSVAIKRPAAGDLVVRVSTDRAQILRFVGRGPVTVPHLPLGIAHEFVALSEGVTPARLLVPKDAEWETTPEGPRYEAAMQLGKAAASSMELGDSLLPQDVGSPSSKLGSVRIVTTPKGAKVYQVIGFAPEAKVESLPLDATQELLIYRKGYAPEVKVVAPSDYVAAEGAPDRKLAELSVTLTPVSKK